MVKLGTVSLDGTKLGASASKRRTLGAEQLEEQIAALEKEVSRRICLSEAPFHVIKNLMGFRRFGLRGLKKVKLEWLLVALAYTCRKIVAAEALTC